MPTVNWATFSRSYNRSDSHWYVSKVKTYSADSILQLREGLSLLNKWFVDQSYLTGREKDLLKTFVASEQLSMDTTPSSSQLLWTPTTELFFAFQLELNGLISEINRTESVKSKYTSVFEEISKGMPYSRLNRKFGSALLNNIAANARNFLSIYKKLGMAWAADLRGVTITSTGMKFMSKEIDWRVVLEKQLLKWQLYNPTVPRRYDQMQVFPYIFLLELLLKLESPQLSKREYTLFATKATSMGEVEKVANYISAYRELSEERKSEVVEQLRRPSRNRARSVYDEIHDSAAKEIGFFALAGPLVTERIEGAIGLVVGDRQRAESLLEKSRRLVFIEFRNQLDWFSYFGDWDKGPTIEDAIRYYAEVGELKKAKRVVGKPQATENDKEDLKSVIKEKDIELWFLTRLPFVEEGLRLYKQGSISGHQFSTEIGQIDILALDSHGRFVVIEFKRDQSSDQTVGQLLRYVGWVHVNLAKNAAVRGIVIASEIDDKTRYALVGTQHPKRDELFSVNRHLAIEKSDLSAVKRRSS